MHATHYYENGVKENEIFYRRPGPMLYTVYAYARNGKNDITNGQVAKEIILSTVLGGIGAIGVTIAAGVTVATMGAALAPVAFAGLAAKAGGIAAASGAGIVAEAVAGGAGLLAGASVADAVASGAGVLSTTYGAYKNARAATRALGLACEKSKLYCERKGNYGGGSGSWLVVKGDRIWTSMAGFNHVICQFEQPLKKKLPMVSSQKSRMKSSTPVRVYSVQEGVHTAET